MNLPLTIECPVYFRGRGPGGRQTVPAAAAQRPLLHQPPACRASPG